MSDRLAKQTFFCCCFEVREGWGMDWGGRVGVERNLNLLLTCRSMYCRSKLILRWEKRFQFCEIYHLDLFFFNIFQIEKFIGASSICCCSFFFAPLFVSFLIIIFLFLTLFHSGSLLTDFFSCLTGSSQYVHVDCQGKEP